jgi:hypothetical protein
MNSAQHNDSISTCDWVRNDPEISQASKQSLLLEPETSTKPNHQKRKGLGPGSHAASPFFERPRIHAPREMTHP